MRFKLLTLFFILYSLFIILAPDAHAQFTNSNYLNTNPDVPQNFGTYTQSVFIEIASALSCQIAGINPARPDSRCLGIDQKTGKIGFVENGGGLIGITGNMIAATFEIPVSSTHYAKYLADNFGIAKKAQAKFIDSDSSEDLGGGQGSADNGVGYAALSKILPLWRTFRNIIYLFFVLIFVLVGLGIMLRIKIDPRTVMTIQNQIPKIVVGLILVSFSYAIAGFIIDIMYVTLYLFYNVFASTNLIDAGSLSPSTIHGSNPLSAVGFLGGVGMAWDAGFGLGGIIGSLFEGTLGKILAALVLSIIGGSIGGSIPGVGLGAGAIGGVLGGIAGLAFGSKLFGIVGGLVAFVVLAAAVLSALFRLWFQLLKAYIFILVNIVLAPFWIAGGLIPGSSIGFNSWFRDLVANLSAFPATLFMFLIGKIFIDAFGRGGYGTFVPPFIGNPGNPKNFAAIVGVGVILLTPSIVTLIRQMVKAPEMKITTAIGQSIGIGAAIAGTGPRSIGRQLFGATPMGGPKAGTAFLMNRLGRWVGHLSGVRTENMPQGLNMFRNPFRRRGPGGGQGGGQPQIF